MNHTPCPTMPHYKKIAVINESHNIFLVQHQETKKIYVKKILDVYNNQIYQYLYQTKIPGIPQIIELYEENDQLTVIEEFVSGTSLQEKIDTNDISAESIIHYIYELCEILEKLHSVNPPIVHRDIKPSNIIITNYDHVMLLDFNAAKYFTDPSASDTILLGTKGYAAPEQYGFGSSTPQTDIYALGILLKQLTSTLPESAHKFSEIINTCTQMNPADRFQSVSDLKLALTQPNGAMQKNNSKSSIWKALIPPGYRTLTPWKIAVSSIIYILIVWLCMSTEFDNVTGPVLWLERFACLLIMLSIIFCSLNYCNIQRLIPLCSHKNLILRCIGIIILDSLAATYLFVIMAFIEAFFFT